MFQLNLVATPGERRFLVDRDVVIVIYRQIAALFVGDQNLIGVLARSADKGRDVGLRQSNGNEQVSVGERLSVPFGESYNPARDAGFDLDRGERLNLFIGRTQTR